MVSINNMRHQRYICGLINYWIFLQTLVEGNNTTICDVANIPQCILCGYCKSPKNETQNICHQPAILNYFNKNPQHEMKHECYGYGDHADFLYSGLKISHISVLPPDTIAEDSRTCYFNISHYNASHSNPSYMDTACVEFGSGKNELLSKHQLWKVRHRMHRKFHSFQYDVTATKGEIISNLKFWSVTFDNSTKLEFIAETYNVFHLIRITRFENII